MALAWVPIDVDTDDRHAPSMRNLDPAEIHDAYQELLELFQRPAWHAQAACRGQGLATWFPARGQSADPARAVCAGCPVQAECLAAGFGERHGIWGGSSERGRRQMRREAA